MESPHPNGSRKKIIIGTNPPGSTMILGEHRGEGRMTLPVTSKRTKGRTGFLDEAVAIHMTLGSFVTRKKKTLIGAAMVPTGILMWFASPYMRADSLHLSVPVGLAGFAVVFLTGFIMTSYGAGLILVDNNLWGD
jgi:hypothetical protein